MDDVGSSDAKLRCLRLSWTNRRVWRGGRRPRELKSGALSTAEWSYLFGLFLADGSSDTLKNLVYRIRFLLQGDEWDLAWKLMELLGRAGMSPHIDRERSKDMFVVRVYSKLLLGFFPDIKALREHTAVGERFLREKGLYDQGNGVPFCAGLIDGDGICKAYRTRSRARKRQTCPGMFGVYWNFTQTKLPFLNEFFERFVESLDPCSTGRLRRRGRVEGVRINLAGREALLRLGFASWSLRAAKCVQEVSKLCADQTRLRDATGWRKEA